MMLEDFPKAQATYEQLRSYVPSRELDLTPLTWYVNFFEKKSESPLDRHLFVAMEHGERLKKKYHTDSIGVHISR